MNPVAGAVLLLFLTGFSCQESREALSPPSNVDVLSAAARAATSSWRIFPPSIVVAQFVGCYAVELPTDSSAPPVLQGRALLFALTAESALDPAARVVRTQSAPKQHSGWYIDGPATASVLWWVGDDSFRVVLSNAADGKRALAEIGAGRWAVARVSYVPCMARRAREPA